MTCVDMSHRFSLYYVLKTLIKIVLLLYFCFNISENNKSVYYLSN